MKERVNHLVDSFVDYKGVEHKFVVAAVSSTLPTTGAELGESDCFSESEVTHEVSVYLEDYGTCDYLGEVGKVVRVGIAVCNPTDKFSEETGIRKAAARAKQTNPVLYANIKNMGAICTESVQVLLKQAARDFKENPESLIKGYNEAKKKYEYNQAMMKTAEEFSDFEKQVVKSLEKDPTCLNKAVAYAAWKEKQNIGS